MLLQEGGGHPVPGGGDRQGAAVQLRGRDGVRLVEAGGGPGPGHRARRLLAGVTRLQQLRRGLGVALQRVLGVRQRPDGRHPLHALLLLHGLLEDEVVDGEHDDDREPEGEGGGDEGVGHVGHEPAVVVPRGRPLLHRQVRGAAEAERIYYSVLFLWLFSVFLHKFGV